MRAASLQQCSSPQTAASAWASASRSLDHAQARQSVDESPLRSRLGRPWYAARPAPASSSFSKASANGSRKAGSILHRLETAIGLLGSLASTQTSARPALVVGVLELSDWYVLGNSRW